LIERNTAAGLRQDASFYAESIDFQGGQKYTNSRPKEEQDRPNGEVAQSVERGTENPCVGGSIPSLAILFFLLHPQKLNIPLYDVQIVDIDFGQIFKKTS
jgi:hypothetical protein